MQTSPTMCYVCRGDLLGATTAVVHQEIHKLVGSVRELPRLELDLRAARSIDSAGLHLIARVVRLVREKRGVLCIRVQDARLRRLMAFTRIDQFAEIAAG